MKNEKPTSVSELLTNVKGSLQRLVAGGQAADRTLLACREVLPAPLAQEVWSAVLKGADLTIFVESPAWATRVRYAAAELKERLGERLGTPLARIVVRVRPRP